MIGKVFGRSARSSGGDEDKGDRPPEYASRDVDEGESDEEDPSDDEGGQAADSTESEEEDSSGSAMATGTSDAPSQEEEPYLGANLDDDGQPRLGRRAGPPTETSRS